MFKWRVRRPRTPSPSGSVAPPSYLPNDLSGHGRRASIRLSNSNKSVFRPNDASVAPLRARRWAHGPVSIKTIKNRVKKTMRKRAKLLRSRREARYEPEELAMMEDYHRKRIIHHREKGQMDVATARTFVRQFANSRIEETGDIVIKTAYQALLEVYSYIIAHDIVFLSTFLEQPDFPRLEYKVLLDEEPF